MLLLAQPILAGERRRRGGLMSFRRHPLFNEALKVFEVSVDATGENRAAMLAWKEGRAPSVSQHAQGPRRRKRRRRGAPEVAT
jgi:poly(A) polymerase